MVNFYRDMWKGRSHVLAPLTELASKKKPFQWKLCCGIADAKPQCCIVGQFGIDAYMVVGYSGTVIVFDR